MFFGLLQSNASEPDEDIATGTYADGPPRGDAPVRPHDRSQPFRPSAHERDYGVIRSAGMKGAGMVA